MRNGLRMLLIIVLFYSLPILAASNGLLLKINGLITPATRDYIERGLNQAAKNHDAVVLLSIDSVGGLQSSARGINAAILSASVPVIAYIPKRSTAKGAASLIMYASPLTGMAPDAYIGSPLPLQQHLAIMANASAYLASLAKLHNRPADWHTLLKNKATQLDAIHATDSHIIDVIANNEQSLLEKMNGKSLSVVGIKETLNTKNITLIKQPHDVRYQFLNFITNPNIAYFLLIIAIYGLFLAFFNPGKILPGLIGLVALLLALYAFRLMPINYNGLTLLLVGIAFMIFEVYVSTYYIVGLVGLIGFLLGSMLLFDIHEPHYHLSLTLIMAIAVISIVFLLMLSVRRKMSNEKA